MSAHRMILMSQSDYLKDLFEQPVNGQIQTKFNNPAISGNVLKKIVEYCYEEVIDIDEDNAEVLLIAAALLQIRPLEALCISHYKDKMTASNCLSIWEFAEQYLLAALEKSAAAFAFRNFKDVIKERRVRTARFSPSERRIEK